MSAVTWAACVVLFVTYAYTGTVGLVAVVVFVSGVWWVGRRSGQASVLGRMWRR